MRIIIVLVLVLAGLIAAAPPSIAASPRASGSCVTCLGPQTNTLWEGYVPLAGFTRYGKPLTKNLRSEVLFIDVDGGEAEGQALLWPLVKALDAFGSWSGTKPAKQSCSDYGCSIPTFDLSHATFRSRYVVPVTAFTVSGGHCVHRLPAEAVALLKHERWKFGNPLRQASGPCWYGPSGQEPGFPLLAAGGYVQIGVQAVTPSDFEKPLQRAPATPGVIQMDVTGLPFATVHDALSSNKPTSEVPPATLYDINAEANLIEALICHGDKSQPKKVCGRTVIKKLLKRIH